MEEIQEPSARKPHSAQPRRSPDFADKVGLPLIVAPHIALGGTGGGVTTMEELIEITYNGLRPSRSSSPFKKSLLDMQEIEFEVIRDGKDQCVYVL